jgi:rare lipoprotein A
VIGLRAPIDPLPHVREVLRPDPAPARRDFESRLDAALAPAGSAAAPGEGTTRYVVRPGDTLWDLAVNRFHVKVADLARDNGIADPDRIYPGQELVVRKQVDDAPREVLASWYGPGFDGRPMANGEPFDRHAATIAHKELPLGTWVELTNPETGTRVRARVTDRGPFVPGREVDLSYGLARKLDLIERGVGKLILRVLG